MKLFLNISNLSTRNSQSNQFLKNNKNTFNLHIVSNNNKNQRNNLSLFNKKEKTSKLYLKKPNNSIQIKEITKREYSKNNTISPKKNKSKNILTGTFEGKKYNIKNYQIHSLKKNSLKNNNKLLINLKKRYSIFSQTHKNLDQKYGLFTLEKTSTKSVKETPSIPPTFFTSVPLEKTSKRNSNDSKSWAYSKLLLRKEYYNAIKLNELKIQVKKFENSENFEANKKIIEKYLSSPDRFKNEKNSKHFNLKKKLRINSQKKPRMIFENNIYSTPKTKSNKSKSLYERINIIEKESDMNKIYVEYSKIDHNYEKTDKILKNALKKIKITNDEATNYLKEIALEYKRELGEYTFYNGKGIYTNHLKILKKGENKLAFMLTNELLD